jgi:hypothetical protein
MIRVAGSMMILAACACGLLVGCAAPAAQLPPPLPPLPVEQLVVSPGTPLPARPPEPEAEPLITFTAANAPVREMLPLLAEAAGVTLLLHPRVQGRVSFHLEDVPAREALRLVAAQAGYEVAPAAPGMQLPFDPTTVFYLPAVNVNAMDERSIRARFGVSAELAEWIVASRVAQRGG